MLYKATEDVVRRVMPLLEHFSSRAIDKARLLQYLSARAGIDWGAFELIADREDGDADFGGTRRSLVVRDCLSGEEHAIRYPACLPTGLDRLVREEYKRLAAHTPLTTMNPELFRALYDRGYCDFCRWQGIEHAQIQRECHFAGHPINFEAEHL